MYYIFVIDFISRDNVFVFEVFDEDLKIVCKEDVICFCVEVYFFIMGGNEDGLFIIDF